MRQRDPGGLQAFEHAPDGAGEAAHAMSRRRRAANAGSLATRAASRKALFGVVSSVAMGDSKWFAELTRSGVPVHVGAVPPTEGHWVSSRDEPEPSAEEHQAFYEGVQGRLTALLEQAGGGSLKGAAYVRGGYVCTPVEQMFG